MFLRPRKPEPGAVRGVEGCGGLKEPRRGQDVPGRAWPSLPPAMGSPVAPDQMPFVGGLSGLSADPRVIALLPYFPPFSVPPSTSLLARKNKKQ